MLQQFVTHSSSAGLRGYQRDEALSPPKPRQMILGLYVLRFAAAVMVMCFHFCVAQKKPHPAPPAFLLHAIWFGLARVEIFFVISGIVIAYSANGVSAYAFLKGRILRLYPAVWICASITSLVAALTGIFTYTQILHGWINSLILFPFPPYADPSYWTLGIEMMFYLTVFLLLATNTFRYLEGYALVLGVVSATYWIVGRKLAQETLAYHLWGRKLELTMVPYGCFFALGVLIYIVSRQGFSMKRFMAIAGFAVAGVVEIGFKTDFYLRALNAKESALLPQVVFLAALVFIFASMKFTISKSNPAAKAIRMLALTTYPLYLIHQIVGLQILALAVAHGAGETTAICFSACCCFALSLLIATLAEPPVQNALRGVFAHFEEALKSADKESDWYRPTMPVTGG
ncbi:MAG: acyltransferase family protein [Janthinobacterium lividum]